MTGSKHVFAALGSAALRSPAMRRLIVSLVGVLAIGFLPALSAGTPSGVYIEATPAAGGVWLDRLNAWRASTGLPSLSENSAWSQGDYNHALYMVKNDLVTHYETPGVPFYTTEGDTAARNSNIQVNSTTSISDEQAIDWWMQAPFHAMGMMDPRLTQTGFGSYREVKSGWQLGAALDTLRGNSFSGGQYPVFFPGDGSSEPLRTYGGGEFPDPLQACSGYSVPSGLPVFVQVGGNVATTAGPVHSFTGNGVALEHCVIDANNPSVGSNLVGRGGVIVIPKLPLVNGVKYVVALTVNGVAYTWSFTVGPFVPMTPCTSVAVSAAPPSPTSVGTSVNFSATSSGCPNPRYRFWIRPPGGAWTITQNYGSASSFVWNGTGLAGSYGVEVDARDAAEGSSVSYDVVKNIIYQLNGCSAVSLAANPASPHSPNGSVLLTGTATCPGTPTYRFWVQAPGGPWTSNQDYGTINTYSWPVGGLSLGAYGLEVDVRTQGGTDTYEKVNNLTYILGAAPCATPTLGANPSSPGATSATITFTSTTTGCATPLYRFWVRAPGGPWVITQDYSATNTFAWSGTGLAGSYGIEVDVREQAEGDSVTYDAVKNLTYVLQGVVGPCTAPALGANPSSPGATGATITFTATTSGCATPLYRFWVRAPGGPWVITQDYSATSTFAWSGTGLAGSYGIEVDVREQAEGSSVTYDAVKNLTYALNGCSAVTLTSSPLNTAAHGTTVTLTATATCPDTPTYKFWIRAPGGSWTVVRPYALSNTFTWTSSSSPISAGTPGTYSIEVDVEDQGGTDTYEKVNNITYVLS
ncbi:MAG TPA: CAP domain-containing protein [Candidatus Dormibacteraeota bacterium]|nr:CAP domain-containing protein [Candidatus Dormibacteraeota bacterium]